MCTSSFFFVTGQLDTVFGIGKICWIVFTKLDIFDSLFDTFVETSVTLSMLGVLKVSSAGLGSLFNESEIIKCL